MPLNFTQRRAFTRTTTRPSGLPGDLGAIERALVQLSNGLRSVPLHERPTSLSWGPGKVKCSRWSTEAIKDGHKAKIRMVGVRSEDAWEKVLAELTAADPARMSLWGSDRRSQSLLSLLEKVTAVGAGPEVVVTGTCSCGDGKCSRIESLALSAREELRVSHQAQLAALGLTRQLLVAATTPRPLEDVASAREPEPVPVLQVNPDETPARWQVPAPGSLGGPRFDQGLGELLEAVAAQDD